VSKTTRRQRETQLLLSLETAIQMLVRQHATSKQTYAFLQEPLARIRAEREMIQLAESGDLVAQMARRSRRGE
jgi:DNA-binding phage protein